MVYKRISVGIDISKDEFHVCLKVLLENGQKKIKGTHSFSNTLKGFLDLVAWVSKRAKDGCQVVYIMEATGVYYEDLAYYLHSKGEKVSVLLPNKIKHFGKSLNIKSKTDKIDSNIIAEIGIERELQIWTPMAPEYKELRDLCRERLSLKQELIRAKSQLHAMVYSHEKTPRVIKFKHEQIDFYEENIEEIETEIKGLVNQNEDLKERVAKIAEVKGLRIITIITVLCETNGFELMGNIRQVVSYAGLDIVLKESGLFKGKTKISKKGNARIRQCLYMPALTAVQYNEKIKDLYERINERNPKIKRKGVVAAMRKLLILIFVLWKKNEKYDPNYDWNH